MIISENIFVKYSYGASCGNGKLEERNDYYPFGGLMGKDLNGDFQSYNGTRYFSLFFRPQAGVFYQYSPEWSFGGELSWDIVPQWYKDSSFNRTGNFLNIGFAARYHF